MPWELLLVTRMSPAARAEPAAKDIVAARAIAVRLRLFMVWLPLGLVMGARLRGVTPLSRRHPWAVLRKSSGIHNRGFREGFVRTGRVLGCEMPAERTGASP